jgi:peptide-methionine (R)-S-oxide reductase
MAASLFAPDAKFDSGTA